MDRLPVEILCKILSYLKTYDLIEFCKAYGNNCFLKESTVIKSIDFQRQFDVKDAYLDASFIPKQFNGAFIKSLNINYIYWIPPSQLRALVNNLSSLEELYALETSLGLQSEDIVEYTKLKKLAISVKFGDVTHMGPEMSRKLEALKSLCLCIVQKSWDYYFLETICNIPNLEELWISDEDTGFTRINFESLMESLKHLKKLVVKSKIPVRIETFAQYGFSNTFECRRSGPATELIYEKLANDPKSPKASTTGVEQSELEKSLDLFDIFLHDLPYGPSESRQIYFKKPLANIFFEELNFCQPIVLCNSKFINAAVEILSAKNSAKLKRLRFRSCLFKAFHTETGETFDVKRSKPTSTDNLRDNFKTISENLKELMELEIEICPECNDTAVISCYSLIQNFTNLRRVSLEVPPLMDGLFLKEIFLNCPLLKYLNLTCVVKNEKFIENLYSNLKYATNLRDFRLEHKNIVIDHLLNALNGIESKKLSRVFVNCRKVSRDRKAGDSTPVYKFVTNNPQLVLFIINKSKDDQDFDKDQEQLLRLMEKNIAKIFWINPRSIDFLKYPAHRDIFFNPSNVSVNNIDRF